MDTRFCGYDGEVLDTRVRGYDGEVLDTRIRGYDGQIAGMADNSLSYQKLGTNYLVSILDCSRLGNGYPRSRV
jgi:hypothetical protein